MKQLLFLSVMIGILLGTSSIFAQGITGNGRVGQQARRVTSFTGIEVGGAFDVVVKQGNRFDVIVEADENLFDVIETSVSDDKLKITTNKSIHKSTKMKVYVTLKELNYVNVSGAASLKGESHFTTSSKMDLQTSGAADLNLDLEAPSLKCSTSSSSDMILKGITKQIEIQTSGSSDFNGKELKAEMGAISSSGSSDIIIHLSKAAVASASGSSDIHILGAPSQTNFNTSGSAEVHVDKVKASEEE